ncbi:MAG TPA: hypothetical protein VE075_03335 [Thermoanaerobaculia bacterium]|nr:hypothetical protein [Thermoanaerobaculia bacterium]
MDVPSASQPAVRTVEIAPPSARTETWNVLRAAALIALVTWIYIADTTAPSGGSTAAAGAGVAAASSTAADAAAASWPAAPGSGAGVAARDLLPYQRLFRTLGGEDQRLFRELQEGLIEAENVRSAAHRWPAAAALAAEGVPPFADAAGRGGRRNYRWQLRQEGPIVNYLGIPGDARDPAFLVLVQEPDPAAPAVGETPPAAAGQTSGGPRPAAGGVLAQATDEVHHRLADGTLLHVSIWMRAAPAAPAASAAPTAPAVPVTSAAAAPIAREVAAPALSDDPGLTAEPYARGWVQLLVGTAWQ